MDTLPISALPTPAAPPSGESAAAGAIPTDAPPEGDFEAALARSLAGFAKAPADSGAVRPDVPGADSGETEDATLLADLTAGVLSASDSAAALLAALPQQLARAEPAAPGASSAMGSGIKHGAGSAIAEHAGDGSATIAGPRADVEAMPGKGIAPSSPGDAGPLAAAGAEKKIGEAATGSIQAVLDWNAAGSQHVVHAPAHAAYSPTAPAAVDTGPNAPAPATPARIETPLGAPGWSTALADQLVVFAGEKRQVAELRINPPHLGPVDITLTMSDDQASAVFASPHAIVRETIESALPRLREVLAESGINLGQASVTADSPRDGSAQAQSRSPFHTGGERSGAGAAHVTAPSRMAGAERPIGLVDLFA